MGLAELAALRAQHPDAPRWKRAVELMATQKCNMAERNPWGLIPSYWYADRPDVGRPGGTARYRYFFSVEYDMPPTAMLMWMLSELSTAENRM